MTFADIALKNARRKFGGYLVFFFSTVLSAMVFFLFCAMYYNPAFAAYRFGAGKMNTLFRASAIAVLLFVTVFTLYSGGYFLKTQKKEIAVYMLLGMRKGRIAGMMFLETFFIGMLAVAGGALLGALSSGFFTGLLTRFMAVGTVAGFSIEPKAALLTALSFCALFGASGLRAFQTIYRYQLIDLLSAEKQSEGVPRYSLPGALLSVALLAAGYGASMLLDLNQMGTRLLLPALAVILAVALGTGLLFRNLVPMLISALKGRRSLYYRATDFVSISQIAFRLKANSRMLAVVSLLSAVAITMMSASYSLYHGLEDSVGFYAPYSYLVKDATDSQERAILEAVADVGQVTITADDRIPLCNVTISDPEYALQNDGTAPPEFGAEADAYLMAESVYLDIIAHTQTPRGEYASTKSSFSGGLAEGECYFIDGNMFDTYCKKLVGKPLAVSADGSVAYYTVTGAGLHKYIGLADLYRHPTVVVCDSVFSGYAAGMGQAGMTAFHGFMFDEDMASGATVAAIDAVIPARFANGGMPGNISYIAMYRANFALYGSYVFIGGFIGILFVLAVGSVLYYKLITEAREETTRYGILRKVGMTRREVRASVAKQLGLTYGLPLGVGLCHTLFALLTYNRMMVEIGQETPTFQNAALVTLLFTAIYFGFYALSVASYCRIATRASE